MCANVDIVMNIYWQRLHWPTAESTEGVTECIFWALWVSSSPIERGCWPIQLHVLVSVSPALGCVSQSVSVSLSLAHSLARAPVAR